MADDRIKVRALQRPQGKAAALNHAVAMAGGDVLVFTDVRQRVARGAVEHLVGDLASPDVGVVSGSLTISSSGGADGLYERYWRLQRQLRVRGAAGDSAVGGGGAPDRLQRGLWA